MRYSLSASTKINPPTHKVFRRRGNWVLLGENHDKVSIHKLIWQLDVTSSLTSRERSLFHAEANMLHGNRAVTRVASRSSSRAYSE